MQSILITGGNLEKRKEKIKKMEKLRNLKISNFDTLFIEGTTSIGIDQIRKLGQWVARKPHSSKFKAAIIDEAEKLTHQAQNALLKTLEEPPKNTLIILTAPQETLLLPTIISRCKIIKLRLESEIKLDKQTSSNLLSVFCYLLSTRVGERIKKAQELAKTREETIIFLNQLIVFLREFLLSKSCLSFPSPRLPQSQAAVSLCGKLTPGQIVKIIKSLLKTKALIKKNVNFKLALDNFFLDLPLIQ